MRLGGVLVAAACIVSGAAWASGARADPAEVSVGSVDEGFARPPYDAPRVYVEPTDAPVASEPERYRSPMRLQVGPAAVTTGRNLGLGLGLGADFGTGTVGARLAAAWLRGDASSEPSSPLGSSLGQYSGELTIDLHKRGPVHPVFGVGFGLVHIEGPMGAGNAGIGTARLGVEYALGLEDADVRIGGGVLGAMPGPADREVQSLRGYAMFNAGVTIGF